MRSPPDCQLAYLRGTIPPACDARSHASSSLDPPAGQRPGDREHGRSRRAVPGSAIAAGCLALALAFWIPRTDAGDPSCGSGAFALAGTTGRSERISFAGVGRPDARRIVPAAANPLIQGDNLYAPDLLRADGEWYCYHGGWLSRGQTNDRVYLARRSELDPLGPWTSSEVVIAEGEYVHVNDPSVVRTTDGFRMVFTAAKYVGQDFRDWIAFSDSPDGLHWSPAAGVATSEVAILDPEGIAGGVLSDIARPSLVRDGTTWRMWFDGRVDNAGGLATYLAESGAERPTELTLRRRYADVDGWPALFEPDMERRPDGAYVGVVQRRFSELFLVTSSDGVAFTYTSAPVVAVADPAFGRARVSNPGLLYDAGADALVGVAFGMTDNPSLVDHDVGFAVSQYGIQIESPGAVVHAFAEADSADEQSVLVFGFTEYETVRLLDPLTGATVFEQGFSAARAGDLWRLDCAGPPLATIRTGLGIDGRPLSGRSVDPRWTIAESPDPGAYGPEAYAVPPGAFPVPPWIGDGEGSRWISPGAADTMAAPGNYTYRATFDLSGLAVDALAFDGRYSADDSLGDVLLNGRSTGIEGSSPGFFEAWHPIEIAGEFRAGENRLDFVVVNGGADANPTGLRVELTLRSKSTVPGDVNLDLEVDVSDAVSLLDSLFVAGTDPRCPGAADFNEDGSTDISDAVAILLYLFAGRPAPSAKEATCLRMPPRG